MPAAPASPLQRRARLAAIISGQQVFSQLELAGLLKRRDGIVVTQATLSRDLSELGVVKGPGGYMLPDAPALPPQTREAALAHALRQHLISVTRSGTLVVIRTPTGHANSLAVELDRAGMSGILGTIAGDDTIFLATQEAEVAQRIARTLERLARSVAA